MTESVLAPEVQPSRPAHLRYMNCRLLLSVVRAQGPCSKADLVRLTGLSAPTVTAAIRDLERQGLVESMGDGQSSGGRPPGILRFRADHAFVAGADIGGTRLRMMLADLNGQPVSTWDMKLPPDSKDPDSIARFVRDGVQAMCAQTHVAPDRVLHIAAGAPGITDVERGVVLSAPNLTQWTDVPLRELIEQHTGISNSIENDTNLAAVGEHSAGAARGVGDFVFVAIGTGVGAGIFLRGSLLHGSAWSAGEIGYLGVPGMPREQLAMQRTGQMEDMIGGGGVERRWAEQLRNSGREHELVQHLRGSEIFDLAADGDRDAAEVLRCTAVVLADAIATITLLFNPKLVVLGGGIGSHHSLRDQTEQLLAESDFPHPALSSSLLGTQAQLFGAVSVALAAAEHKLLR